MTDKLQKNAAAIIAGTHSGSGKTTITLGIMAALQKRGLTVQPFKSGPDFIDPSLHKMVTGRTSRNLDLWMMGEPWCRQSFARASSHHDISIIEGVMGMFDGDLGSSHALGKALTLPTILVIDARSMAQSAAAIVKGFEVLSGGAVKGVIANRIASERHLHLVQDAIEKECDAQFLGHLPRSMDFAIPSRHLGLHLAEDAPISKSSIDHLAETIEQYVDLDTLLKIAQEAHHEPVQTEQASVTENDKRVRIAIARDKAFCFYYQDNIDLLQQAGAEILFFSPLEDAHLPHDIDGIYLGGGYPELYAETLSHNGSMLEDIRTAIEAGMPTYAECGGFMYLTKGISDENKVFHPLASIFPTKAAMKKTRAHLGYREVTLLDDSIIGKKNTIHRGHEFHYSTIEEMCDAADVSNIYSVDRGGNGYCYKNCLGSYIHLHFGYNSETAGSFVNFCKNMQGAE